MVEFRNALSGHRERILPILIALSLLAGVVVSILSSSNAHADYYTGCGYGYDSSGGSFGYAPSSAGQNYGFVNGGAFGYGYGNQICPLAITTTSVPSGTVGVTYSTTTLSGTGGVTPYAWTETGSLGGLTLSSSGQLSGTPTSAGTFPFTVTMTDANGQPATASLSLSIASGYNGGGTTTTAPTTTTTAATTTTTTTTAPTTTTTVKPRPHQKPNLVFQRVVGLATARGVKLQFKCLSATCHARVSLSAILRIKHGQRYIKSYVVVAWRHVPLAKNHSGAFFFNFNNIGRANLGGNNHYHNVGLRLTSTVIGGNRHQQVIHISK
jgi:hypothetical protein